ncbi:MAG: class III extradiol dioxygenase subunit B-like domain-containing protein [Actinomycetota bacterium]|nr:class III extradiol dioxygenase subunit B-like domain-containing protein [Actinomycetota bacterium]
MDRLGILGGCIVPHPPLLIPDIGGRELKNVHSTYGAMERLGEELGVLQPEVLVMMSPHSPPYRDAFAVRTGDNLQGSFAGFGCPQVRISKQNDVELLRVIKKLADEAGLPLAELESAGSSFSSRGQELDHGLLVPLYYLDRYFETPIVAISISGLDYSSHFRLGRMVKEACENLRRRAVFVASGDLSHRLKPVSPAGFNPRGEEFDRLIVDIASSGDFDSLYDIDEKLVEEAGECGFRPIHTMWGALKNGELDSSVYSYEGPFGVGYLVSLQLKRAKVEK